MAAAAYLVSREIEKDPQALDEVLRGVGIFTDVRLLKNDND